MRVGICWDVETEVWQRFYDGCQAAAPFQGPAWHAAWSEESGERILPVAFRFDDGERAMLALAIGPAYRGLLATARSGVAGGYGGLISPRPLTSRHSQLAYDAVRRRFPELKAQSMPHATWPTVAPSEEGQWTSTLALRLQELPALREGYNENRRRDARRGDRYTILTFKDPTPDSLLAFLEIYRAASAQWAFERHRHSDRFWLAIVAGLSPATVLHLALDDGTPVAARLVGYRGGVAYDLAFCVHPSHRKQQAATAVTEAALAHAHASQMGLFDFMPSGSLAGVWRFKASFGARAVPVFEVHHRNGLARLLGAARKVLVHG